MSRFNKILALVLALILAAPLALFTTADGAEAIAAVNTGTVEAPSYTGSNAPANLFDGNLGNKYCTSNSGPEIVFELTDPAQVIVGYAITSCSSAGEVTRDPKSWALYGSNDKETWTKLDARLNQVFPILKWTNTYSFANSTSYAWYKFAVTANCGSDTTQFAELTLYTAVDNAAQYPVYDMLTVDTDTVVSTDPTNTSETAAKLFDGNLGSKYCTAHSSAEIAFALTEAAAVNSYAVSVCNSSGEVSRDPKDWTFYGSNDGSAWTALDSRTEQDFSVRSWTTVYTFDNETSYLWYKLEITANHGTNVLQFAELTLFNANNDVDAVIDPSGVEGTAGRSGCGIEKLFDGAAGSDSTYRTEDNVTAAYVQFTLTAPAVITGYGITTGHDNRERDPKDWSFYGSEDGENWTLLDSRTDMLTLRRDTEYTFSFENQTAYTYYKLDITANSGGDSLHFAELTVNPEESDSILVVSVSGPQPGGSETIDKLFDGNTGTKYCITSTSTPSIVFSLNRPQTVTSCTLTSGNDSPGRDPRAWALYGSADGENWTLLTEVAEGYFNGRRVSETYCFENQTAYQWYKFDVRANWGAKNQFQMCELELGSEIPEKVRQKVDVDMATVEGTAANSDSQAVGNLFDGSSDTKYLTFTGPTEAIFALNAPKKITHYALTSANDHAQRDPADWTFYGSNDKETWTVLDVRTGEVFEERYQTKTYEIAQGQKYLWYKLEITSPAGEDPWGVFMQLADLAVYETIAEPTVTPVDIDASTVATTAAGTSGNAISNIADHGSDTRYLTNNTSATVTFALTEAAAVNRYSLISSKDHNERYPSAFDFYGSNDGETWTLLDSRTNQGCSATYQKIDYNFENTTPYVYYKLDVTAVGSGSYLAINELLVYTVVYAEDDPEEALKGDIDCNGVLNISDITALLDYLRLARADLDSMIAAGTVTKEALDLDGNGALNISDVTELLDMLS